MNDDGLYFDIFYTRSEGHASRLVEEAAERAYSVAVAAGGDGTCNEVINGLMSHRQKRGGEQRGGGEVPTLAVLPVGRGNDFCYGAGIPANLDEALRLLGSSHGDPLDVGVITGGDYPEGRYFGNGIGIGFDTIVGLEAAKNRFLHGSLSYVYGALRTLILFPQPPDVSITWNSETRRYVSPQVSILNGRRMGGTFFMAPDGDVSDGRFDLCFANRRLTRREMVGLVLDYIRGTQARRSTIETDRAESFRIIAPAGGLVCHADGETICVDGTELHVECIPAALTILRDSRLLSEEHGT